jgi:hypothetical protein
MNDDNVFDFASVCAPSNAAKASDHVMKQRAPQTHEPLRRQQMLMTYGALPNLLLASILAEGKPKGEK